MADTYRELINEINAEESAPAETPKPAEESKPVETAPSEEPTPAAEPKPAETAPSEEPPKKPSEHTPQERAEFAFKRQLAKQREKYEAQLQAQSDKFAAMQKQLDELRKKSEPAPVKKKRAEFKDDEDYLEYLAEERSKAQLEKLLADRDEKEAEIKRQEEQKRKEAEEEQRIVEETRNRFISLTEAAFNNDSARKDAFFKKIQYANEHGLGEVLGNEYARVAKDFFFNNPDGPVVFEKMLNDRPTLERIFNDRTASSPLEMFYELKSIASEIRSAPQTAPTQTPQTTQAAIPHLGKPGKQSASNAKPDIFNDDDAMLQFLRRG